MKIKVGSLFDGIGGAPLSAVLSGAEPVWASEIEKLPTFITKRHFPNMKHYGDITQINGAEIEPVDIIVGGSPCQDLSVAGKRAGLAGERSGLFMEQVRIVKEMREHDRTDGRTGESIRPRYMVWENVPGAFSSNGGEDFRAVLEETAKVADPSVSIPRSVNGWANAGSILADGFSISWRTFDAQYWGVLQRRRRIYLVADFGGHTAPEICFEQESVQGGIAQSRSKGKGIAADAERSTGKAGELVLNDQGGSVIDVSYGVTGTLRAQAHGHQPVVVQSEPTVCRMVAFGEYSTDGTCSTMKQRDYKDATDLVVEPICFEPRSQDGVHRIHGDISPTLNTAQGGQRQPCVMSIDCRNLRETAVHGTLQAKENGGQSLNYSGAIRTGYTVRRLTPLECERLQGYPDGWTALDHEDKPVSDTQRYKALGNSFAIPNALFVISRCVKQLQKDQTGGLRNG